MKRILITEKTLSKFTNERNIADRSLALLASQKDSWEFISKNYKNLDTVQIKEFEFDGFRIKAQHNPNRIISTTADVNGNTGAKEGSFLFYKNLPEEQKGLRYYKDYLILCNPYPIFTEHFTIPSVIPKLQLIKENLNDFLFLSRDMQKYYVVFYNGPMCGASAPDHLHFQAGNRNFMPIDDEYESIKKNKGKQVFFNSNLQFYFCADYLRSFISIESNNIKELSHGFKLIYSMLQKIYNRETEPMMNILAYSANNSLRLIIFPRHKHRPDYYFKEGEDKIVISPGAVDMGGTLITPREEDFNKLTKDRIIDIYKQVSIPKEFMEYLKKKLLEFKAAIKT